MSEPDSAAAASGQFTTTHWSVVIAAGKGDAPQAIEALEKLCRTDWYPIYAYLRRRGCGGQDAQDLTQGFFCSVARTTIHSRRRAGERQVPLLPARLAQLLHGRRTGPRQCPEAGRRAR